MALSSNARASMARMAQGSGPEADAARRAMNRAGVGSSSGGGGGNLPVRRMPGAGGPRAIGPQRAIGPGAPRAQMVSMGTKPTPVSVRPRGGGGGGVTTNVSMGRPNYKKPTGIKAPPPKIVPKQPIKKSFMSGKGIAIGAGAAVIAGLAMNRRGDGTSSGRSGMTRY